VLGLWNLEEVFSVKLKVKVKLPVTSRDDSTRDGILGFRPYFDIRHKLERHSCQLYAPIAIYLQGNTLVLISSEGLSGLQV
jgi:hypothetical protein